MPNESAETDAVRISHDLYQRLREHCDRHGIRFHDFAEDALENSLLSEMKNDMLEKEVEGMRRKAEKYEYAFNLGFRQGFSYLFLMLNGLTQAAALDDDLAIVRKHFSVAPKGQQMKLL